MYLCYMDESGTSDIPGNTSHFVLAGIAISVSHWRACDREISAIKRKYRLHEREIHTAWMRRPYIEQSKITDFENLSYQQRVYEVTRLRNTELLRLQQAGDSKRYKQAQKNYRKTTDYIHLTYAERMVILEEIAACVASWSHARLFAECIDKVYFDPNRRPSTIDEQAFEQVVSRFERYLQNIGTINERYGVLIHDNNETVSRKHTNLMRRFHERGTFWTTIDRIIETPLFVDSQLTSMVQIADLCSYALRRYLENDEETLFDLIFQRADRQNNVVVGVRHFTENTCQCKICASHRV